MEVHPSLHDVVGNVGHQLAEQGRELDTTLRPDQAEGVLVNRGATGTSTLYYPYPFPRERGWILDSVLYFDQIHVIGLDGDLPDNAQREELERLDLLVAHDPGERALDRPKAAAAQRLEEIKRSGSTIGAGFLRATEIDLGPPSALPAAGRLTRGGFRSLGEIQGLVDTHPDIRALCEELGLEQAVAVRSSKFLPTLGNLGLKHLTDTGNDLSPAARRALSWLRGQHVVVFHPDHAWTYMTALAAQIALQKGWTPSTDADYAGQVYESTHAGFMTLSYSREPEKLDYTYLGEEAAVMALVRLAVRHVSLSEDTTLDQVLRFKERNRSALTRFQTHVENLARDLSGEYPSAEAAIAAVQRTWMREVVVELERLEEGRRRLGLRAGPEMLKAAFLSSTPPLVAAAGGARPLIVGATLGAGALNLLVSAVESRRARLDEVDASPCSYILRASNRL